jgi:hypothetical protein
MAHNSGYSYSTQLVLTEVTGLTSRTLTFDLRNGFTYGGISYPTLTNTEFQELSVADFDARANALLKYVQAQYGQASDITGSPRLGSENNPVLQCPIPSGTGQAVETSSIEFSDYSCQTGTNGTGWELTAISTDDTFLWEAVAFGNGKFVAVKRFNGVRAYSTDGINWTVTEEAIPISGIAALCFGGGKFVAISTTAHSAYSTDGITWTQGGDLPRGGVWVYVIYGNGKFVKISESYNSTAYSTDGITWTQGGDLPSDSEAFPWKGIAYGNSMFVVFSRDTPMTAYSIDGITWTQGGDLPRTTRWGDIAFGNGKFVITEVSSSRITYSTDCITWTSVSTNITWHSSWETITYGGNYFIAAPNYDEVCMISTDGITWSESALPITNGWQDLVYGGDRFVIIPSTNNYVVYGNPVGNFTLGKAFAKTITFRRYDDDEQLEETVKSVLTNTTPILVEEDYLQLSVSDAEDRVEEVINAISGVTAETVYLNNPVINKAICSSTMRMEWIADDCMCRLVNCASLGTTTTTTTTTTDTPTSYYLVPAWYVITGTIKKRFWALTMNTAAGWFIGNKPFVLATDLENYPQDLPMVWRYHDIGISTQDDQKSIGIVPDVETWYTFMLNANIYRTIGQLGVSVTWNTVPFVGVASSILKYKISSRSSETILQVRGATIEQIRVGESGCRFILNFQTTFPPYTDYEYIRINLPGGDQLATISLAQ